MKPIPTRSEHEEQAAFFKLVDLHAYRHKGFLNVFAIPNGGHRHKAVAVRLRAEGVRAGVPDIFVAVSSRGYAGLFIEMKRSKGGRLSKNQKLWFDRLTDQGYLCECCHGCDAAWATLCWYLRVK